MTPLPVTTALRPEDRRRADEPLLALEPLVACFRSEAFAEDLPEPTPTPVPLVLPFGSLLAAR